MDGVRIQASKPCEGGQPGCITHCERDDPAATRWSVGYPGMPYTCSTLDFDSKYMAEKVEHALTLCFEAGGRAKIRDFRRFIGVG